MVYHVPVVGISISVLICFVLLAIYRLYLSPYAAFPGPKLAALTHWYTFYYDVTKGGQYIYKIEQLHKIYGKRQSFLSFMLLLTLMAPGPVLRISPDEVHINDPDFYDILFSNGKRDKPPTWAAAFGNPGSMFSTTPHNLHRVRRSALSPYFSPASVRRLEPLIQDDISRLIAIFRRYQKSAEPIPLKAAFAALTSDIITESCFATQENYIEASDFNAIVLVASEGATDNLHFVLQFKWIVPLIKSLPDKVVVMLLGPGMALLHQFQRHCEAQIKNVLLAQHDYQIDVKHKTIFHDILDSDIPPQEKTADRLWQEAQTIVSAGTVTTATTLSSMLVYLLLDPPKLHALLQELEEAIPDISKPASHKELEKLPYLTAVIQETLRIVSGVSFRLARSAPDEALQCGETFIPPNVSLLNALFTTKRFRLRAYLMNYPDKSMHARLSPPPLPHSLPSPHVFPPRALASGRDGESQIPGPVFPRHEALSRDGIGECGTVHDRCDGAEGLCEDGDF
ncbi:Cytochrome P450 monooxygenase orf6 [Hyphodiscus hymeniophilus]|uniref:Cytochrome P450 monooxygenase orf6 n=1 Tax=Hyphodiscus hymeniophilus TaxID=353542 RepID=A0A9P6VMJ2_9HELO|nr:Cytochrome P450 monooxygenase orf6 [Hyphodiscus hymeniophilus]